MAVILDAMGGDNAPEVTVEGALKAAEKGIKVTLVGVEEQILPLLKGNEDKVEFVHAEEVVEMAESPADAFRKKPNSSIAIGLKLAKTRGVPFVSAGNTGACMAGSMFAFGRIKGVKRPPIVSMFPKINGGAAVVLDVGANVDCDADTLLSFAIMGNAYARTMFKIESPKIALLSNGEESKKGNAVTIETHEKLKKQTDLNFIGNVEGFDALSGDCDVIVTDGFVGNVLLKTAEGVCSSLFKMIKKLCLTPKIWVVKPKLYLKL